MIGGLGRATRTPQGPLLRGRVTVVRSDGRVDVKVGQTTYLRCDILEGPWFPVVLSTTSGHTHTQTSPAPLGEGQRVLLGLLEGRPDEAIVLGRIRP